MCELVGIAHAFVIEASLCVLTQCHTITHVETPWQRKLQVTVLVHIPVSFRLGSVLAFLAVGVHILHGWVCLLFVIHLFVIFFVCQVCLPFLSK